MVPYNKIEEIVNSNDWKTRLMLAKEMENGKIIPIPPIEILEKLVKDEDPYVRRVASRAATHVHYSLIISKEVLKYMLESKDKVCRAAGQRIVESQFRQEFANRIETILTLVDDLEGYYTKYAPEILNTYDMCIDILEGMKSKCSQ